MEGSIKTNPNYSMIYVFAISSKFSDCHALRNATAETNTPLRPLVPVATQHANLDPTGSASHRSAFNDAIEFHNLQLSAQRPLTPVATQHAHTQSSASALAFGDSWHHESRRVYARRHVPTALSHCTERFVMS